ncbi:MAG TPA: hypothetical protein VE960_02055 [bacterium]|nr:hypothetical protein [bacterium]
MVKRLLTVTIVILGALGLLLSGCSQNEEQAETSACSVTCEGKGDDMECTVTCAGVEGKSEYTVTCDGCEDSGDCMVTCEGADGEMECTVTCEGEEGEKTSTITCDGKTVTCEHADGGTCTCTMVEETAGCPGAKAIAEGGTCPSKAAGTCPMSSLAEATEDATK